MENLNLKLDSFTGNELVVRTGSALPLKEPNIIVISGDINTISSFINNRKDGFSNQAIDKNKAVVVVDKKEMKILLDLDPENPYGTEVHGSLELSDELKTFHVNTVKRFTREELVTLLKFNRLSFDSPDQWAVLLKAYQMFKADTQASLAQESDNRGNKANSFNKSVTSNIPQDFVLLIPIFKGKEAARFRVEICLDVTDGGARFWLESTELHELIKTQTEVIFNEELKSCAGFVIVNR